VVTALTLHVDSGHLITNLGFGMLFGYLAGQLLGPGIAWASILAAGALGNFLTRCSCRQPIVQSAHRLQYSRRLVFLPRTPGDGAPDAVHAGPIGGRH